MSTLTYVTYRDIIVRYQLLGPVDGLPDTPVSYDVSVLCSSFRYRVFLTKRIESAGFGTLNRSRPGKMDAEAELELDVSYTGGPVPAPIGQMARLIIELPPTGSTNDIQTFDMIIMESDLSASHNDKAVQRLRLEGIADSVSVY